MASLANSSMLLEGQLIEVPGLGNGSSVCSDDSRAEDFNADHTISSPRLYNYASFRQAPVIVRVHHHVLSLCSDVCLYHFQAILVLRTHDS